MTEHSVTQWINDLKDGDEQAAQQLWERYFEALTRLARRKLGMLPRRVADEEDIALSAFDSFYRKASDGKFPKLDDRDDLWKLLFTITERKAYGQIRQETRQKRGSGNLRGESVFQQNRDGEESNWKDAVVDQSPTPEYAAEIADQVRSLLTTLDDDSLRTVALMKMEGCTNQEVADTIGCSERSVKRKLQVIRTIWSNEPV